MNCTGCQNPMITAELDDVEVDFCPRCGGIWLDAGEIEILLGDKQKSAAAIYSFRHAQNRPEKKRKCPICLKRMEKIAAGPADEAVLLDRCVKGDGLWFDRGELEQIIRFAKFDDGGKVIALLENLFKTEHSQGEEK